MDKDEGTRTLGSTPSGGKPTEGARSLVGQTVGNYRIVDVLGEGGMGAVYLGERPEIESRVAIKVLHQQYVEDADMVRRFFDEARAVNRVGHPGLVQIHDYDRQDNVGVYLVMEYLKGRSLRDELRKRKRLPHDQVVRVLLQVASALAAVHEKGIIHRDLKPENIQLVFDPAVTGGERVKLLDFGIAKLRGDGSLGNSTRTGLLLGTPLYMAPEQCKDTKGVDHRADIYAVGAITYELLCGRPPYLADSMYELVEQHLTRPPAHPRKLTPSVPRKLGEVVLKALAVDPDMRYQTMEAMADAAQAAMHSSMMESTRQYGEAGGVDITGPMPRLSDDSRGSIKKTGDADDGSWNMETVGLQTGPGGEDASPPSGLEDTVASERMGVSALEEASTVAAPTGEQEAGEPGADEWSADDEGVAGGKKDPQEPAAREQAPTLAGDTTSRMMAGETGAPRARSSSPKTIGIVMGVVLAALVVVLVVMAGRNGDRSALGSAGQPARASAGPGTVPAAAAPVATRKKAPTPPPAAVKAPASPPAAVKAPASPPAGPDAEVVASKPPAAQPEAPSAKRRRRKPRRRKAKKQQTPPVAASKKAPAPTPKKQPKKKSESDLRFTDLED